MTFKTPRIERMLALVEKTDYCWIWHGSINAYGYGKFGGEIAARAIYKELVGPIPEGHQLDHFVCENPRCVRPDHVRPVTPRENTLRARGTASANLAKTHCPQGHEYNEENTYKLPKGGRHCKICMRRRSAEWYQRKKTKETHGPRS